MYLNEAIKTKNTNFNPTDNSVQNCIDLRNKNIKNSQNTSNSKNPNNRMNVNVCLNPKTVEAKEINLNCKFIIFNLLIFFFIYYKSSHL